MYNLQIPDAIYQWAQHGVSRRHAVIRLHDTCLELIDLDSKNGTSINGVRFFPKARPQLRHQDTIKIGRIQIQISFISETEKISSGQTEELS